jgi:hypothetical protein
MLSKNEQSGWQLAVGCVRFFLPSRAPTAYRATRLEPTDEVPIVSVIPVRSAARRCHGSLSREPPRRTRATAKTSGPRAAVTWIAAIAVVPTILRLAAAGQTICIKVAALVIAILTAWCGCAAIGG